MMLIDYWQVKERKYGENFRFNTLLPNYVLVVLGENDARNRAIIRITYNV